MGHPVGCAEGRHQAEVVQQERQSGLDGGDGQEMNATLWALTTGGNNSAKNTTAPVRILLNLTRDSVSV